jgi:hypothetical protein
MNTITRRINMPARSTNHFDIVGHTVVVEAEKDERKRKAHTPEWLSQALNEGDGSYKP